MFGFFKAKSKPEAASGGDAVDTLPPVIEGRFKYEVQHGLTRRETPRGVS